MEKFDIAKFLSDAGVQIDAGKREQIEYIPRELIDSDPNNFYSLDGLDALADNVATVGLQQPIRVRKLEDGRYITVSGHRRRAAIDILAKDDPERWEQIPCIVESGAASPAMQQLALIYANSSTRQLSGVELSKQAEQVEKLLYQLKEEGYEFPGRMRDHVAEAVNASKSKLARLKVIRSKLIPQFMRLWEAGSLRESVAYTLAGQVPVRQKSVWIAQTDSGKKKFPCTDGWLESIFREMDRLERLCKKTPCGINHSSTCDHLYVRLNQASGLPQYSAMSCRGCCLDCFNLASCRYSCERAADAKKALRDKTRADRKQAAAEQKAKEQPERDLLALAYSRVGRIRKERNISAEDFVTTSLGWHYAKDMDRLTGLEDGSAVSLNDRMPGSIWAREAKRLIETADLLGCSIDYMLGRDVPEKPISDVPNLGTGWYTGLPGKPGSYAVIAHDPGATTEILERCTWDGSQWTIYGAPVAECGIIIRCWMPMPPEQGTCVTGLSGSGKCGAAAYCSEPVECCSQCDRDCNGRCGWLDEATFMEGSECDAFNRRIDDAIEKIVRSEDDSDCTGGSKP